MMKVLLVNGSPHKYGCTYTALQEVVSLPDIGIKGNTHFMMADLNNRDVADAIAAWLHKQGLDK
mgnify:CR=1 FL=1